MKLIVLVCLCVLAVMPYVYCQDINSGPQPVIVTVDGQKNVLDLNDNVVGHMNAAGKVCDATDAEIGYIDNSGILRAMDGALLVKKADGSLVALTAVTENQDESERKPIGNIE